MGQAGNGHDVGQSGGHGAHGSHHTPSYYVKIWATLLVLLIISIMGPMLGNKAVTIFTAFGIAIIKALMVAAFFMHLNVEKRYIWYMLYTMVAFLALFFFAVAPDVMKFEGRNWVKPVAMKYDEDFAKLAGGHHGEGEHGAAPSYEGEIKVPE